MKISLGTKLICFFALVSFFIGFIFVFLDAQKNTSEELVNPAYKNSQLSKFQSVKNAKTADFSLSSQFDKTPITRNISSDSIKFWESCDIESLLSDGDEDVWITIPKKYQKIYWDSLPEHVKKLWLDYCEKYNQRMKKYIEMLNHFDPKPDPDPCPTDDGDAFKDFP